MRMLSNKLFIAGLLTATTLGGCTSATRGVVNPTPAPAPQISPVLQEEQLGLKRVVAIARFSDETTRANNFLVDKQGNRLGKQASDILASRLTATQKFIMLERDAMEDVMKEAKLDGEPLDEVGADYIIVGSVSEFGRSNESEVGVFSRNRIQVATATVNVRLINTRTGEIVYAEEATGQAQSEANQVLGVGQTAGYNTSLDDRAISAAISKLVSNVMENLLDAPWQAYLVGQHNGQWLMTGGKSQGIEKGQRFTVVTPGKLVKNPQTGMNMELPASEVATIEVVGFMGSGNNEMSLCSLVNGNVNSERLTDYRVREEESAL
ncbi:CsgG/HfaB family protein [Marisediminitalea sp.]|uniref:CsgG/HfaB family protein n=1 Tax=Marisediminitalea sp. TaxID=2662268 RepID=UPI0035169E9C